MFTKEEVMAALRKAVELKGEDYTYPESEWTSGAGACSYAHNGQPSCIVGHVINILDPEAFAHLAQVEVQQGTDMVTGLRGSLSIDYTNREPYLPIDFWDADSEHALLQAQIQQDNGQTWGDALAAAEDKL